MIEREILIRQVCRTGAHTVERSAGRYYIAIRNRTYSSEHEVTVDVARRYYRAIRDELRTNHR